MKNHADMVKSSGNVFADLGFDEAEAEVLAMRADLIASIKKTLAKQKMTQVKASKLLGISQSRVSSLSRGEADKFRLDKLVVYAAKLGMRPKLQVAA